MNLESLELSPSFARAREAFGVPIGDAPAVPTDLARLVLDVSAWDAADAANLDGLPAPLGVPPRGRHRHRHRRRDSAAARHSNAANR